MKDQKIVWTIGHSTRSFDEFASLLSAFHIRHVLDIRRFPGSKKFPQFNKEILASTLGIRGFKYTHLEDLGGRRNPMSGSKNTSWRVKAFQGYADYMETETFKKAITKLEKIAQTEYSVFMCSEAVWWSCHRSLVSDHLKVRGWTVMHIMGKEKAQQHPYTKAATVIQGTLHYDIAPQNTDNSQAKSNQLF